MNPPKRGFSLLELLVVLAISGILLAIGLPGLRELSINGARREASTSLYTALNRARSEAIARNSEVRVCSRDLTAAAPACSSTLNWMNGMLVFLPLQAGGITPLAESPPMSSSLVVQSGPSAQLSFNSAGRPTQAAEFLLCTGPGARSQSARRIRVQRSGNVVLEEASTCS